MRQLDKDERMERACRLARGEFPAGDTYTRKGWKKRMARHDLVNRVGKSIRKAEDQGLIDASSSEREVKKAVAGIMWSSLFVRWILAPLINHLIIFIWNKYIGTSNGINS